MLGERLKQLRKEKALSQQAFAAMLGTASGYISEIEKGKTMPGSVFLCSLKREFPKTDLNWLLTGELPEIVAEEPARWTAKDPVISQITQVLDDLDLASRQEVLKYAEERKQLMELRAGKKPKRAQTEKNE